MKFYLHGFKQFIAEDEVRSLNKDSASKKPAAKPENYLDGIKRELGINPNNIPKYIESGPIELEDEGLWFNQAIWEVMKPIQLEDPFVRIKFHKSLSPNLNQTCYRRKSNGEMEPFSGSLEGKIIMLPMKKFAELFSRGWQGAVQGAGGMGGLGGGLPPM
jgi:hypothetical protein